MKAGLIALMVAGVFGAAALASWDEGEAINTTTHVPAPPTVNSPGIVDSPQADETYLTIYPDNLAMVTEVRRVTLPEGAVTLRILGVSDQIISQTAVLQSFEGISLERNFDSDLITKGALLNSAVGSEITIRRVNPASGEITTVPATLVSASKPPHGSYVQGAVFKTGDGLEALECAGLYETVLFSQMPNLLNPAPVLSMDVRSDTAGEKEFSISYLTQGIGWEADYRLDVNGDNTEGALKGWLTVTNATSKSFNNVPTAIIAGEVNRDSNTRGEYTASEYFTPSCWPRGSTKTGMVVAYANEDIDPRRSRSSYESVSVAMFAQEAKSDDMVIVTGTRRQATREDLGDYKLYRTPQPVTVAAHQTKQIAFLSVPDAEIEQLYKFKLELQNYQDNLIPANIEYEIDNSKEGRLAQPLPRGTVRIMMTRPNGQTAYLGEDDVRDLAVDLPVEIGVSESLNVKMRADITGVNDPDNPYLRISGDIFNALPETIMAEIEINDDRIRVGQIGSESHTRAPDETIPTYNIPVPALSQDAFYVDIPMEHVLRFQRKYVHYKSHKLGDTARSTAGSLYRFKGQGGTDNWGANYFTNSGAKHAAAQSTLLSVETFKSRDGLARKRFSERHAFTNTSGKPVTVQFDYLEQNGLDLISASIPPDSAGLMLWSIVIPPNGTAELTVTAEADEIP